MRKRSTTFWRSCIVASPHMPQCASWTVLTANGLAPSIVSPLACAFAYCPSHSTALTTSFSTVLP